MTARTVVIAAVGAVGCGLLRHGAARVGLRDRVRRLAGPSAAPGPIGTRLGAMLAAADVRLSPAEALQCWLAGAVAVGAVGAGLDPRVGAAAAVLVLAGGPMWLHGLRHRRARRRVDALPDALERVASELRSGGTVVTALERLAAEPSVLGDDCRRIGLRLALGDSLTEALRAWAAAAETPPVTAAAGALAVAAQSGGAAAGALDGLAASLRDRLAVAAETRALSAQARMSALVVGVAPFGYTLFSALIDPRTLRFLVGTNAGRLCVLVAVVLELAALVWMRVLLAEDAW